MSRASGDERLQSVADALKPLDLAPNLGELGGGPLAHIPALRRRIGPERKQLADLAQSEAELLRFADEAHPLDGFGRVATHPPCRAWRLLNYPLPLVKADGLYADAGCLGGFADRYGYHAGILHAVL